MEKKYFLVLLLLLFQNNVFSQNPFITTWETTTTNETITIPTATLTIGTGYDYTIDWGDGTIETNQTGDATHTYATAGTQTISISGDFPRIYFDNSGDKDKILTIEQWGDIEWTSMLGAFYGCGNLNITNTAIDTPDLSLVRDMRFMFRGATVFNQDLNSWDVSNVLFTSNMFQEATAFNQDLSSWDVSKVRTMTSMFNGATSFNQDLTSWNVSSVTGMASMFSEATSFNQPLNWTNTSSVTNMFSMFLGATAFDQDLSSWDVSNVTDMRNVFSEATVFNQDLSSWDVSSATNMSNMFYSARSFNQDLSSWNVSNVTDMSYMFRAATSFNQPLNWTNTSSVTNMIYMFSGAIAFDQDLSSWDVSNVTSMLNMFWGATVFNQDLSSWNVSNVTNMRSMFSVAIAFDQDLSSWDVSNVTSMSYMFNGATLFNQPLDWTNTSSVTDVSGMFNEATVFNQDLSSWDVSSVTTMSSMFNGATSFNQPLNWTNTSSVTNVSYMFDEATSFNQDLSNWDVSKVTTMREMFDGATSFDQDLGDWNIENVTDMFSIFRDITLSVANYDALLKGWSAQTLQSGVNFDGGDSKYCTAETERQSIKDNFGWTIYDKGKANSPAITAITAINEEDTYTLPAITGTDLSTNEKYYTGTLGTGTGYSVGDVLTYDASTTYPITLYAYDSGSGCGESEESFTVTLTSTATTFTPFITTWKTTTANESISIPTTGTGYDYTIDWGDGTIETNQIGDATHTYATAGTQTISISGDFPRIYFNNSGDKDKILTIEQWGDIAWTSMEGAFQGCANLNITNATIDTPDLSLVTSLYGMFADAAAFNKDISNWDVSSVTNMAVMFLRATAFNQDLSNWNVSSVTNMYGMFYGATAFNESLDWSDTSALTSTENMFRGATAFNQDISGWNFSNVTTIFQMFYDATAFNQDISAWNVAKVTNMSYAFYGASVFNQDLSSWDVSKVTTMAHMFESATSFNQPLDWDVSNVTTMANMFLSATSFDQNIGGWDVSKVTDMANMFYSARAFNQDISTWIVSNVTKMSRMFLSATAFNQNIAGWDVSKVTNMTSMFSLATSFDQNLESWNVENVTDMSDMFYYVTLSVANYDALLKGWSTQTLQSSVTFSGGNSEYCTAELERQSMIDTYGWTITDGGKAAAPVLDAIAAVTEEDSYTLPAITGTDLSGNEKYYTAIGGTGTEYSAGDILTYDAATTYPITLYAYDSGNGCGASEESFTLTLTESISFKPFITTWQTTTANESITIPTTGGGYDYTIDWGDGTIEPNQTGAVTHTYATAGIHTVSISGDFSRIYFNDTGDKDKILTIEQWGDLVWNSMSRAFRGCSSLTITNPAIDNPDLSLVTDMSYMFADASSFDGAIANWDVSGVTTMANMFEEATAFNHDISGWNVENVSSMFRMFRQAHNFNQDINGWDVSKVTTMAFMFSGARSFNQDLNDWDVSAVVTMDNTFNSTPVFNGNISSWVLSSLVDARYMFAGATVFNQDISGWFTDNVRVMRGMFSSARAFDQNLGAWNVENVTDMTNMFSGVTLSVANYDALLKGWSTQTLQTGVTFSGGNSQYCTAETERQSIIDNFGWTITDDGKVSSPTITVITDVNEEDSYTLPAIIGTDLSGTEKYYTGTGGTGTEYSAGDVLTYDASTTYPITLYAYDSGSSCGESEESFGLTLTSKDTTNPTASNPVAVTVECSGGIPTVDITVVIDEADDTTTNPTVAFVSDVSDGNSNPEVITRTYSVTDAAGNSINVEQIITINDTTNPTASNPSGINVSCSADVPAADITIVTDAADNCTTTPTVVFVSDVSDGNSNPEVITRTYSVADAAGNSINIEQIITVNDTTNPTASNPSGINVSCSADVPAADASVITDAADNCITTPTVVFVGDVSDGNSNPEVITRTYSVTDAAGNSINVEQIITVNDTTNPTASNPSGINVSCSADVPAADASVIIDAADNCAITPTVAFVSDVSDGNSNPEVITRTYSVTDAAGNSINVEQIITVNDTTDPEIICPSDIIQTVDSGLSTAIVTYADPVGTDNCAVRETTLISGLASGSVFPLGNTTITFEVTDVAGNTATCSFEVIVETEVPVDCSVNDNINPEIVCPSDIIQTVDYGLSTAIVTYADPVGTDNCTVESIIQIAGLASGSQFPLGTTTITFEIKDKAGNTVNCSFDIVIEEDVVFTCEIEAGEDQNITAGEEVRLNATTTVPGVLQWSPSEGLSDVYVIDPIASPTETTTYTLSFISDKGCVSEDTVTVFVTTPETDETKYGFSPDGDGINEYWEIDGIDKYPNNVVEIYNRWGDLVFEITGYNNASNAFRGIANRKRNLGADQLPEGTYFFNIKIEGPHHLKKETGFLVLKR